MKVVLFTVVALGLLYYLSQSQPAMVPGGSPFPLTSYPGIRGTYSYALDVNGSSHAYVQVPGSPGLIMVTF